MQIRTGLRAGFTAETISEPLNILAPAAALVRPAAGAGAAGELPTLDALWNSAQAELKLWAQRMQRRYGRSGMPAGESDRFWEIDLMRGVALAEMLLLHFGVTWLKMLTPGLFPVFFKLWMAQKALVVTLFFLPLLAGAVAASPTLGIPASAELFQQHPALLWLLPLTAVLLLPALLGWLATTGSGNAAFLLISGVSLAIGHARQAEQTGARPPFDGYLKRGAELIAWGLAISALSFLLAPAHAIVFGTLSLMGVSAMLAYPFLDLPAPASLAGGLGVLAAGAVLQGRITHPAWQWLIALPASMTRFDPSPLLPWFGALLIGVAAGKLLYPQGRRALRMPDLSSSKLVRPLQALGRYSLPAYLLHMPFVLIGASLAW